MADGGKSAIETSQKPQDLTISPVLIHMTDGNGQSDDSIKSSDTGRQGVVELSRLTSQKQLLRLALDSS